MTPDGQQLWHLWVSAPVNNVIPNGSGGLLLTLFNGCDGVNPMRLASIDGTTGMWAWEFIGGSACTVDAPQIALRADGAVAVATPGNLSGFPSFMMLGAMGTPLSVPAIPPSTFTSFGGQQTAGYSRVGPTIVDVDGTVHVLYEKRFVTYPPQVLDTGMWLLSVRTDQTSTTRQLSSTTQNTNLFPGRILPDGNGGLLATWIDSPIPAVGYPPLQSTFRAALVPSAGLITSFDLPLTPPLELLHPPNSSLPTNPEFVLGENNEAFMAYGSSVASFYVSSGLGGWSTTSTDPVSLQAAASNGILWATAPAPDGTDNILKFFPGGGVTVSTLGLPSVSHVVKDLWTSSNVAGGVGAVEGENIDWATTGWSRPSQGGQRRTIGVYRDQPGVPGHQSAAFEMMTTLRPKAVKHEWGGIICQDGTEYRWGAVLVEGDGGSVDAFLYNFCTVGAPIADVHLHVHNIGGLPNPSTPDLSRADAHPEWIFYLSAKRLDNTPGSQFIRYRGPAAASNTCYWFTSTWLKYTGVSWIACGTP